MVLELLNKVDRISDARLKVVVAMSGGVDSSVVAALLNHFGHEVIGITLQLYDYAMSPSKKGACCAGQDIYDASIAAEKIGIPHYVLNYESLFKEAVINDFVDSYLQGETPIPCVKCNQNVKFKDLLKVAKDLKADCLATGHYVRRVVKDNKAQLHSGFESIKDQSYFLFATTQDQLEFLRFPLGELTKSETRALAQYFGLTVAQKPDSQDICFVPSGSYSEVVRKLRPGVLDKGNILFKDGTVLGQHNGIIDFTIGQRRGIGIAFEKPLYVIDIRAHSNEVIVGYKEDLGKSEVTIREVNWLCEDEFQHSLECKVRLRSSQVPLDAEVVKLKNNKAHVLLKEPYLGVTPGQGCVMYVGSRVMGGGWIEKGI